MKRRELMGGAVAVAAAALLPAGVQPTATLPPARLFVDTDNARWWIQEKVGAEYRLLVMQTSPLVSTVEGGIDDGKT